NAISLAGIADAAASAVLARRTLRRLKLHSLAPSSPLLPGAGSAFSLSMVIATLLIRGFWSDNAAQSNMAHRTIDGLCIARGPAVVATVVSRAKTRPAFQNLAGNLDLRLARIVALIFPPAARILRNAAGFCRISLVFWRVPVAGPFPDIADHVAKPVAVRQKRSNPPGPPIAIAA